MKFVFAKRKCLFDFSQSVDKCNVCEAVGVDKFTINR